MGSVSFYGMVRHVLPHEETEQSHRRAEFITVTDPGDRKPGACWPPRKDPRVFRSRSQEKGEPLLRFVQESQGSKQFRIS